MLKFCFYVGIYRRRHEFSEKNSKNRLAASQEEPSETADMIFGYSIWLGWLNSALNPIIYYTNIQQKSDKPTVKADLQMSLFSIFV